MSFWNDDETRGWHDVAQICLNGHVINDSTIQSPQFNQDFCDRCGQPTITQCRQCNKPIQGEYHSPGVYVVASMSAPAFCLHCGAAHPWTKAKLKAAHELALELDNLNEAEKEMLSRSFDDLVRDTPSTPVAATRFKKLAVKAGKEGAGALKDILVDIVSETAKKLIWPS